MSSEALERAPLVARDLREWAASMDHAADSERIPRSHEAKLLREAAALLAEVARLERAAEHAEAQRATYAKAWVDQQYRLQAAEAALAVAREREQRAVDALRELAEAEDQVRHVSDAFTAEDDNAAMTAALREPVARLRKAWCVARAALVGEPAAAAAVGHQALGRCRCGANHTLEEAIALNGGPGSASAAADEPGETPA